MAADLLESRRAILIELNRSSEQYFQALVNLDTIEHRYLQSSRDYLHYISERILWIRSTDLLTPALISGDAESRQWLLSAQNWWAVLQVLGADPFEHPFAFWPTVLAVLSLFYVRMSIRPRLRALGVNASKRGFLRYGPTGQAAALTLMSSITAPASLLLLSWRLAEGIDPTHFVGSVATAVQTCAVILFPVELLRESCRHMGLAEAHFTWPTRAVAHLRRVLTWTKSVGIPVAFFGVVSHGHQPLSGGTPTERILFIGGMLLAAVTLHRLLSGSSEFMKSLGTELPNNLCTRFRHLWYAGATAVPAALAALSLVGYHYSATQVGERLIWTLWLVAVLVLIRALAVRWIVLSRRRLLLDQAYQRRAAAAAEESADANSTPKPPVIEETDVTKSTQQTRKLVNVVVLGFVATGLAMIWAETLPAFGLLDRPLWQVAEGDAAETASILPGKTDTGAAQTSKESPASAEYSHLPVTTLDVGVAVIVALFTFLASRNLPGLMEMSILNRLPVDNATRYAATRLASYTIVIVGVLMATNRLGLRWQNVQWLAAALTVGLGFGLQEVFANFISGLIILFERPIRVGDIVTIDDVSGVVSKIRMRATTITNWDRKEFIVPNKEFITGRVLNWTLSDSVNRITINVGVAYGTDAEKVRTILLQICDEHPLLLKDPAPVATFEGFGDSTLKFALRCFLPTLEGRLDTVHEINTRIVEEFRRANIEIALPQRDLRIRSIDRAILPMWSSSNEVEVARERAAG
jgi:potassium efflux system protein